MWCNSCHTSASLAPGGAADDYFAGGRSLRWYVVAGSLMSLDFMDPKNTETPPGSNRIEGSTTDSFERIQNGLREGIFLRHC